ncbi:MAG: hypothetical protein GX970_08595 [Phyllobacteriaceae bacterium]|nr:hypothetical protein [Phyllobacteriaceae bacterium]
MSNKQDKPSADRPEDRRGTKNRIPAGPHARPDLTDKNKTPGTGSLPEDRAGESDVGPD